MKDAIAISRQEIKDELSYRRYGEKGITMTPPLVKTSRESIKANLVHMAHELNRYTVAAYAVSDKDFLDIERQRAEVRAQTAESRIFGAESLLCNAFGIHVHHNFLHSRPYARISELNIEWDPHEPSEAVPVE